MKVILVLGCWGNQNNGLCLCSGIENEILDLTLKTERNKEIVDYLDINSSSAENISFFIKPPGCLDLE